MTVLDELNNDLLLIVLNFFNEMYLSLRIVSKHLNNEMNTRTLSLSYIRHLYDNNIVTLIKSRSIPLLDYIISDRPWVALMNELYPQITPLITPYVPSGKWDKVLIDNIKNRVTGRARVHLVFRKHENIEGQLQYHYNESYNYTVVYGDVVVHKQKYTNIISVLMFNAIPAKYLHTTILGVSDYLDIACTSDYIPYSIVSTETFKLSYWKGYDIQLDGYILKEIINNIVYEDCDEGVSHSSFTYMKEVYKVIFYVRTSDNSSNRILSRRDLTEEELKIVVYTAITYDEIESRVNDNGLPVFPLRHSPCLLHVGDEYELRMILFPELINSEYVDE